MSEFSENLAYLRIFKDNIPHEISDKNDLLKIKFSLKLHFSFSHEEFAIKKAFNNFLNQHIDNKEVSNNHYFMDAKIKDLEKLGYSCIDFAARYTNFKNINRNKLENIESGLSDINAYIKENIQDKSGGSSIPQTFLMADFTEGKLKSKKIEDDFLEISRRSLIDNFSKQDLKKIYRYLSLSLLRKPECLLICFSYFYRYKPDFNLKNSSVYDYYVFKFVYHLICYTNFFSKLKKIKKEYEFKVVRSSSALITYDNVTVDQYIENDLLFLLFCNSKHIFYFYPSKNKFNYNSINDKNIVITYERGAILNFSECLFYPPQYSLKDIKTILFLESDYFKRRLLYSIAPYKMWKFKEECEEDFDFENVYNISVDNSFLSNDYYIREIKRWAKKIDKENRKIYETKYKKSNTIKGFFNWTLEELVEVGDCYEVWRVGNKFNETIYIQFFYTKDDMLKEKLNMSQEGIVDFSLNNMFWIAYKFHYPFLDLSIY